LLSAIVYLAASLLEPAAVPDDPIVGGPLEAQGVGKGGRAGPAAAGALDGREAAPARDRARLGLGAVGGRAGIAAVRVAAQVPGSAGRHAVMGGDGQREEPRVA